MVQVLGGSVKLQLAFVRSCFLCAAPSGAASGGRESKAEGDTETTQTGSLAEKLVVKETIDNVREQEAYP